MAISRLKGVYGMSIYRKGRFRERSKGLADPPPYLGVTKISFKGEPPFIRTNAFGVKSSRFIERTWDALHPGPPFKEGGPFSNFKSREPWGDIQGQGSYSNGGPVGSIRREYTGGFAPSSFGASGFNGLDMSNIGSDTTKDSQYDPSAYGPGAWNKFKPKPSDSTSLVALIELKDTPEMLRTTAEGFHNIWKAMGGHPSLFAPKHVANQFLNHEFGWVPFLSDLHKMHDTFTYQDRRLDQFKADNGKWVRRRGTVRVDSGIRDIDNHEGDNAPLVMPTPPTEVVRFPYADRPAKWGRTTTYVQYEDIVTFSASFKYWVPSFEHPGNDPIKNGINRLRALGLTPSPTALYKVIPWTWLVDWFSTTGTVVSNYFDGMLDNLIAKYAYVMRETHSFAVNESTIHLLTEGEKHDVRCMWYQQIDTKCRTEASPFGFGLSPSDFTGKQNMILNAILLSRD